MSERAHVRGKSGSHPAVVAYRKQEDSLNTSTFPALEALNARLDRALEKASESAPVHTAPPRIDPRREPDDDGDVEIVIDVFDSTPPASSSSQVPSDALRASSLPLVAPKSSSQVPSDALRAGKRSPR